MDVHARDSASFFPLHRAFLAMFDRALKTECGYTGPMPYWDWTRDINALDQSPVWKSFGGTTECLDTPLLGRWELVVPRSMVYDTQKGDWVPSGSYCLKREYKAPADTRALTSDAIGRHLTLNDGRYNRFREIIEKAVGYSILGIFSVNAAKRNAAPIDPLFYLLVRNIDRIWAFWQARSRVNAIAYTYSGKRQIPPLHFKTLYRFLSYSIMRSR